MSMNMTPDSDAPLSHSLTDSAGDEPNPIASILARADHIAYPVVRPLFNYVASKVTTLAEPEISRLSDDEISRLIKDEFSRLPDAEKDRLLDAEKDRLTAIADRLFHLFASNSGELTPLFSSGAASEAARKFIDDIFNRFNDCLFKTALCFGVMFVATITQVLVIRLSARKPKYDFTHIATTNAAKERLRSAKRSVFLSRYSRTSDPKGFKDIGEIFSQELLSGVTQEEEQHQEGTSEAVVPSSTVDVDDPNSFS